MVLQLLSRTLLEGTSGSPQTPDMLQSAGCRTLGHVVLFQTAPEPAALHRFHPAQPAWFPLPCPITSQLDLASSPWLGQFPFWLVPWGGISCDSAGTMQQGKAHRAQRDRQRRRHLWHLLCVGSYITLWYSGVEATWRHNGSAGSSWMLQNKKHVEKSAVQRYSFVSDKKTGQPRKLVKYCSPMS